MCVATPLVLIQKRETSSIWAALEPSSDYHPVPFIRQPVKNTRETQSGTGSPGRSCLTQHKQTGNVEKKNRAAQLKQTGHAPQISARKGL